ncbi:ATP-binding protein [Streptomyces antibioticus]|uniref:ATP-binding protein n=1 Tax=Streptomyces antibioticus TaxID=1890 RepID=UPI0033DA05AC
MTFGTAGLTVVAPPPGDRCRIVATADEAPSVPGLPYVQDLMDERAPGQARITQMVWSSRFRVHHRIAERYREGRLLPAGEGVADARRATAAVLAGWNVVGDARDSVLLVVSELVTNAVEHGRGTDIVAHLSTARGCHREGAAPCGGRRCPAGPSGRCARSRVRWQRSTGRGTSHRPGDERPRGGPATGRDEPTCA